MGTPSPTVIEVGEHPDHRQIATFFLGWLLSSSLQTFLSSGAIRHLFRTTVRASTDFENGSSDNSPHISYVHPLTLATLCFCFGSAGIAQFGSLLSFNHDFDVACSFAVAWGAISANFGRLVPLTIILCSLRRLGIGKIESAAYLAWMLAGLALVFVTTGTGIGSLSEYARLGIFLCDRNHNLALSLSTSLIYSLIELYAISRLLFLTYSPTQSVRQWIFSLPILRSTSLLILELLTVVPSAIFTGILGEFIPFAVGATFVLAIFGIQPRPRAHITDAEVPHQDDMIYVPSIKPPPSTVNPQYNVQSVVYSIRHPYSMYYEDDHSVLHRSNTLRTARSSRTFDSRSLRSASEAIVEVARRARYPFNRQSHFEGDAPPMPYASTLSLGPTAIFDMTGTRQPGSDDGIKPESVPVTPAHAPPASLLDPLRLQSRFSTPTTSLAPSSPPPSLPTSPRRISDRHASSRSELSYASLSPTAMPTASDQVRPETSRQTLHAQTRPSSGTSDASLGSDSQVVTVIPPSPDNAPPRPSDSETPFRAMGFKNPIPLPRSPLDLRKGLV
ncbi:hypothetical protein CYLTODRAFT_441285 [Cylindrobasidium torrendii FP15055 ss-10]|uniref:Uncharacterized protein n=1 Tax=Cylindrobasidium torrendii FP15055 ss-10 TaxID=1314674 RepID=A0A0D7BLZ0_9AGAR|nr:hypothetical protein CYLTODRAFT_441285 [Cylindrobasidium torrendii FP15055 ss-10]